MGWGCGMGVWDGGMNEGSKTVWEKRG